MEATLTESEADAKWLKGELDKALHVLSMASIDAGNCLAAIRQVESACDVHNPRKSVEIARLKWKMIEVMQDFDKVINKGESWLS